MRLFKAKRIKDVSSSNSLMSWEEADTILISMDNILYIELCTLPYDKGKIKNRFTRFTFDLKSLM